MNLYTPDSTKIVHNTSVDMTDRSFCPQPVHLVQYDKQLPILAVKMYQDGQPYVIPNSAKANIRLGKRDRTFVYNPALGVDESKTIVYFEVSFQMATLSGEVNPVVEIDISEQIAASGSFPVVIDRNPVQEDMIESSTEYITAKEHAEKAVEAANKAKASENAAKEAETNAKASENAAKEAETNAKASENAAKEAETNAKASENAAKESETNAKTSELLSKSYADGDTGIREGEETDNSKYYSEQSKTSSDISKGYLTKVEQAGNTAVDKIKDALDMDAPNFQMDLSTGHLMYEGGRFVFHVNNIGHLEWGLAV